VLSGQQCDPPQPVNLRGLRIAVPTTRVFDDIDPHVARTFDIAIATIADAGAQISRISVPEFAEVGQSAQVATFPAAEGFAWHRDLMDGPRIVTILASRNVWSAAAKSLLLTIYGWSGGVSN
jgi:aspartyl-tRNA(Asn)/glutamyl-tRNA(Gln) amidotransferase subunit A